MNSHFQLSATTSTRSGALSEAIGRYGSSACVLRQISTPSTTTIRHGMVHTTTSIAVECDQSGA